MTRTVLLLVMAMVGIASNPARVAAAEDVWIKYFSQAELREGFPSAVEIDWAGTPSHQDVVEQWTQGLSEKSFAFLRCELSVEGALRECEIEDHFPADKATEKFFLGVTGRFKASSAFTSRYGPHVAKVAMLIMVQNSAGRPVVDLPCPSPFCNIIPPPPPPPEAPEAKGDCKADAAPARARQPTLG